MADDPEVTRHHRRQEAPHHRRRQKAPRNPCFWNLIDSPVSTDQFFSIDSSSRNDNENAPASHKDWICWPSEHDKLLMDLLVENSLKGQKFEYGFRIGAWRDMAEKLNANAQVNYNVSHLNSRLMSYRREYRNVNKMLTYRGFSWDPVQQMAVAGDAEWRECLEGSCSAALFRRKRVPLKELEIICASSATSYQENKLPKVDGVEIIAKDDEGSAAQVDPAIQQNDD